MPSNKHQLLARVNFPLYTVQALSERHILVAGGGGGSKTGIPNVIEIYELFNNVSTFRAESVAHFETGSEAIMNSAIHRAERYTLLFAGIDGYCRVYKIRPEVVDDDEEVLQEPATERASGARRRRTSSKSSKKDRHNSASSTSNHVNSDANHVNSDVNSNLIPKLKFGLKSVDTFQTDFSAEPFQKLARYCSVKQTLLTAGSDGHIRFWKSPSMNKVLEVKAHSDDVDDLDVCPFGQKVVSVSRDGHAKVWSAEDGSLISELKYVLPNKSDMKYIFRSCRFSLFENKNLVVFASINPAGRMRSAGQSYICKWNATDFSLKKISSTGSERLSSMAVSDDGRFLGLGTQEGSVKIYVGFSLQPIYNVSRVHGIFVTGMDFLPTCEESQRLSGGHEASLISISVDNHIIVHHIPTRASMGMLTLLTLLILTLFLVFVIMDFLNL